MATSADGQLETLRRFYDEHLTQAFQHEQLRAQATSILSAIAAGVVGLAGFDGLTNSDIPAGIVVVLVAILGVFLSLKHYERYQFHCRVLERLRAEIETSGDGVPIASTQEVIADARMAHWTEWSLWQEWRREGLEQQAVRKLKPRSLIARTRLHVLWALVPASIGVAGVLVIILAAVR